MASHKVDWVVMLQRMNDVMVTHPWWTKRCDGTPLANDLPVRAAQVALKALADQRNESADTIPGLERAAVICGELSQHSFGSFDYKMAVEDCEKGITAEINRLKGKP